MILQVNHLNTKAAATTPNVVEALQKLVEEGHIDPAQFASLQVPWFDSGHAVHRTPMPRVGPPRLGQVQKLVNRLNLANPMMSSPAKAGDPVAA